MSKPIQPAAGLNDRLARLLTPHGVQSKRMFGGTCFLVNDHMVAGTLKDALLVRVGKDGHADALKLPGASTFDMTGRPMRGFIAVDATAIATDEELQAWLDRALTFVATLPPKATKPATLKKR